MRPVIGLSPLWDNSKESYWMLPGYMKMLEECGAVPLMLPLTHDEGILDHCLNMCNGILLTGGQDVSPSMYGAEVSPFCGEVCEERDRMDRYLLISAIGRDLPVLGICRGLQLMNAALGGTLYQDLPSEYQSSVNHVMTPPYDRGVHNVTVLSGTPLSDMLGEGDIAVNSYHHQAVKDPASCLKTMAISEDGLIEAMYMPGKHFVVGVQWHPEFAYLSDPRCLNIAKAFVKACEL
ncbi:MAG: gamma-glutamyl-gamma-aminobutyrate hydrolase family protein [Firmicutes bacterium]|nr:gamma-glutamyl-gamma-aminobutyrate hydrolase family protein [Bacillota bacterium]